MGCWLASVVMFNYVISQKDDLEIVDHKGRNTHE